MNWWDRLRGVESRTAAHAVEQSITRSEQTRNELFEVVAELERLVTRLGSLPEVKASIGRNRREGDKK